MKKKSKRVLSLALALALALSLAAPVLAAADEPVVAVFPTKYGEVESTNYARVTYAASVETVTCDGRPIPLYTIYPDGRVYKKPAWSSDGETPSAYSAFQGLQCYLGRRRSARRGAVR